MSLVFDSFTEASDVLLTSHTPDTGGSWSNHLRTMTVVAAEGRATGDSTAATSAAVHSATPSTNQYDIEAVCRESSAGGLAGVRARAVDINNYIQFYLNSSSGWLIIEEVLAAAVSEYSTYSFSILANTDYALKMEVRNGTNLCKGYLDGVQRVQITADQITSIGKAGVRVRLNGRVDNFRVTDPFASRSPKVLTPVQSKRSALIASVG